MKVSNLELFKHLWKVQPEHKWLWLWALLTEVDLTEEAENSGFITNKEQED